MTGGDWPADGLDMPGACPVCGARERDLLHDGLSDVTFGCAGGRWTMWRCKGCASGYLDPRPAESHIALAYGSYYTHEAAAQAGPASRAARLRGAIANAYINARFGGALHPALPFAANAVHALPRLRTLLDHRYRHLPCLPRGGGRLLDVGCGNGDFLRLAREIGWQVEGVEPDPAAASACRAQGLAVREGAITQLGGQQACFDAVTISHVIEHVHDPRDLLARVHGLLRPGGWLYVETPNVDAPLHGRFGPAWRGLEAPRHLQLFSRTALHDLVRAAGFARTADLPMPDPSPAIEAESLVLADRCSPPVLPAPSGGQGDPAAREFLVVGAWR